MGTCDDYVRRIVSGLGLAMPTSRRDLEQELRDHLEDAIDHARSEGYDEASLPRIVCGRFGDADEITRQLALALRPEQRANAVVYAFGLMASSFLTVACLILALQVLAAIGSGTSLLRAFPHFRDEVVAFGSLAMGYMGLYLQERLFPERRLLNACVWNSAAFAALFTVAFFGLRLTLLTPIVVFGSGLAVRVLQQTALRSAWYLGTAIPMVVAWLVAAPFVKGNSPLPLWGAGLIKWTGLTLACHLLNRLAKNAHYVRE